LRLGYIHAPKGEILALDQLPKIRILEIRLSGVKILAERYLICIAAALTAIVFICAIFRVASIERPVASGLIRIKVHQGDSLWNYATKYGDRNEYILKRVYKIAKMNRLDVNRPLKPGQELVVPCDKGAMYAQTP
jgi:hypothetical protein